MKLNISLAQIDIQLGDPETNFARAAACAAQAAQRGSDLLLLPELWTTGYDLENWPRHAAPLDGAPFARFAALARTHKIALGGSLLEAQGEKCYNTFVLFDTDGARLAAYRKIHLFRLMDEHVWLRAGASPEIAATPWGPTGLATCYDLRFPELFRGYALAGTRLTLLVAEWPAKRIAHWRTLLRARAIENQTFIAAVNRVGTTKDETFGGHSVILTPWGEPAAEGDASEMLVTGEIDLAQADQVRTHIPIFADRRPDVYE